MAGVKILKIWKIKKYTSKSKWYDNNFEPSGQKFSFKQLFKIYFHKILPIIGKLISKDNSAYNYLPNSVEAFPNGENFIKNLYDIGFSNCKHIPLSLGIVDLYVAIKK